MWNNNRISTRTTSTAQVQWKYQSNQPLYQPALECCSSSILMLSLTFPPLFQQQWQADIKEKTTVMDPAMQTEQNNNILSKMRYETGRGYKNFKENQETKHLFSRQVTLSGQVVPNRLRTTAPVNPESFIKVKLCVGVLNKSRNHKFQQVLSVWNTHRH